MQDLINTLYSILTYKEITTDVIIGVSSRCSMCKVIKPANMFAKTSKKLTKSGVCKKCNNKRCIEWQAANKDKLDIYRFEYYQKNKKRIDAYKKKWRDENKERCTAFSAKRRTIKLSIEFNYTSFDVKLLKELYNSCAYCASDFNGDYTVDHIIPLNGFEKKNIRNDIGNLVLSCKSCNSTKSNKRLDGWLEKSGNHKTVRFSSNVDMDYVTACLSKTLVDMPYLSY